MMFSARSIQVRSKPSALAVLGSLGSLPLLGSVFTGFVLGGLLGFRQALVCIVSGTLAAAWLRSKGRDLRCRAVDASRAARPGNARKSAVAERLFTLWTVVNIAIHVVVLEALCGPTWLAVAGLAGVSISRMQPARQNAQALAGGIVLLLFYPVCLGLIASCVAASTWVQILATPASMSGVAPVLGGIAWVTLASLVGASMDPQGGAVNGVRGAWWRANGAAWLVLKFPACFLGILVSASYYDAHGFQAGFGKALSWAVWSSTFCTRWIVVAVFVAGLSAMSRDIFMQLRSRKFEWFSQGVIAGASRRP